MKQLVLTLAAVITLAAQAYLPPVSRDGDVTVTINGFDQDVSNSRVLRVAQYPVTNALPFSVTLANDGATARTGELKVWLNDDWTVDVASETLTLPPRSKLTVSRTARAGSRVLAALYPVHASFGEAHPIGIFEATGSRTAWKVSTPVATSFAASCSAPTGRGCDFTLAARGETFYATVTPGPRGLVDGTIAFRNAADAACRETIHGFDLRVMQAPDVGCTNAALTAEATFADGRLVVLHRLAKKDGSFLPLRAVVTAEKGALKVQWDMPGVVRDAAGLPRYGRLRPGSTDQAPERVFAGFGNVIVRPKKFSLSCRGFDVSARHAGVEYPNGLALVHAVSLEGDFLECDRDARAFGYAVHHDDTFYFLPSGKGAFQAARNWRDVNGFVKGAGFDRLAGRFCIDEWSGSYAAAADNLRKAARYGLTDTVFVKHCWQRWGYDYRLPEIYPPSGDTKAFPDMVRACRDAGILLCLHDNYIDLYPDAENFSYDLVIFNPDGRPQKAWFNQGRAAQSYRWLPHAFMPWLERNCRLMADASCTDGLFIDVFTAMPGIDYRDRTGRFYPKTRTSAEWGAAFDKARTWLGVADAPMISEAGDDHLVGHVDGGQSDHFHACRLMDPALFADAERTPWHDMGTHGRMILFAGGLGDRYAARGWDVAGDREMHGWGSDDYLSNAILGGRNPMCGGSFNRRTVATYWLQHDLLAAFARAEFETLDYHDGDIHRQHETFSAGGEAWVNRSTNDWTVAGVTLPPYGYVARAAGVESSIALKDGQRCAWARSPRSLFADARPKWDRYHLSTFEVSEGVPSISNGQLRVMLDWTVRKAVEKGSQPFVHLVPKNAKGEEIVRHGRMALPPNALTRVGRFEATLYVDVRGLDPAKYDVFYGIFCKTHRYAIAGADGSNRRRLGAVASSDSPARQKELGINVGGKMLDFGLLRTNGALKFDWAAGRATVRALPCSLPFAIEIDLAKIGLPADVAVTLSPAAPTERRGSRLCWTYDPLVEAYELTFASPVVAVE